jgi:hypothetical protein
MPGHEEEAAIQADAYIDALLARPRLPSGVGEGTHAGDAPARRAAEVLSHLPRFHPSFAFEDALAARLRAMAVAPSNRLAEVIPFPGTSGAGASGLTGIDRRLLVGGAIVGGALASGVSAAALYAWWHAGRAGRRPRHGVVA